MILATSSEMRRADDLAINKYGIPSRRLMENAGRGAFEILKRKFTDIKSKKVHVVAGKGNNGGDGFVVARHLKEYGVSVKVQLLAKPDELKGDALINYNRFIEMDGDVVGDFCDGADIYVDAIFGTGLAQSVHGHYAEMIKRMNGSGGFIFALDIPSGLSADTGMPLGVAAMADMTATFGLSKLGLVLYPGMKYAGEVEVVEIGIPEAALNEINFEHEMITGDMVKSVFYPRSLDDHKGSVGHLLVIAGSRGKLGAALMVAKAALRTGVGLVTLAVPESAYDRFPKDFPEVMIETVPSSPQGTFSAKSWNKIHSILKGKTALAVGPGIEANKGTVALIQKIVTGVPLPVVIDADGINCLKGRLDILKKRQGEIVLTPHPGEMGKLLGISSGKVQEARVEIARKFAKEHKVYLVLKGFRTLIATPGGKIFVNPTGNPGMATAGMGDALTGILGALVAQKRGLSPFFGDCPLFCRVLCAGVYLHGHAGDMLAKDLGDRGMITSDLIEKIPYASVVIANGVKQSPPSPLSSPSRGEETGGGG